MVLNRNDKGVSAFKALTSFPVFSDPRRILEVLAFYPEKVIFLINAAVYGMVVTIIKKFGRTRQRSLCFEYTASFFIIGYHQIPISIVTSIIGIPFKLRWFKGREDDKNGP